MEKNEQIKALLDAGISEDSIIEALNVSIADIERATADTEKNSAPVPSEPKPADGRVKLWKDRPKFYGEKKFNEGKILRAKGLTYKEIGEKQGFSMNFIAKALKHDTYAELEAYRAKDRAYKTKRYHSAKRSLQSTPAVKNSGAESAAKPAKQAQQLPADTIELRSIADSLARIAEALGEIAKQPKKHGLFRR